MRYYKFTKTIFVAGESEDQAQDNFQEDLDSGEYEEDLKDAGEWWCEEAQDWEVE